MAGKYSRVSRAGTTSALLLLVAVGCGQVSVDSLPNENHDPIGAGAGSAGASGGATGGDSFVSAGAPPITGGSAGSTSAGGSESAGEGGEAGEAGKGGAGPVCSGAYALCAYDSQCTDLRVGNKDGDGVANCGSCGNTCNLTHASGAMCVTGVCAAKCQTGFADCNAATKNDGCETDVTSVDACGGCQRACSKTAATGRNCNSGKCVPQCAARYADCNPDTGLAQDDGCETFLDRLDHCSNDCSGASVECDPTKVCNSGSCVAPSGVVVLTMPTANAADAQRFSYIGNSVPMNLQGGSATVRVYAPGATSGQLSVFLSDNNSGFASPFIVELSSISQKWTDITVQSQSTSGYDPSTTKQINLVLQFPNGSSAPTTVYVDSIRSSNPVFGDTFDSSLHNFVKSSFVVTVGSKLEWAASVP